MSANPNRVTTAGRWAWPVRLDVATGQSEQGTERDQVRHKRGFLGFLKHAVIKRNIGASLHFGRGSWPFNAEIREEFAGATNDFGAPFSAPNLSHEWRIASPRFRECATLPSLSDDDRTSGAETRTD
jgi:hypothetical protein